MAKDEELDYFKKVFENVLLEKIFINIFEESKIENFIIEIYNLFWSSHFFGFKILSYSLSVINPVLSTSVFKGVNRFVGSFSYFGSMIVTYFWS